MPTPRLPTPGSDAGIWGDILNEFLLQSHTTTGIIRDNSIGTSQLQNGSVTSDVIATDAVDASAIQDGTVTKANLVSGVQSTLDKADTAVQSVNGHSGTSVTVTATDVAAIPTSEKGAASGVATLDGSTTLTSSQLPATVGTKSETKAVVNHGATAGTARPSGYGSVEWIGSVEPTNAVDGDTWVDTST